MSSSFRLMGAKYLTGLSLAVGACLLHLVLRIWVGNGMPFLFFMAGVAVAAPWLGKGPALLVLVAGILNGTYWFPPIGELYVDETGDLVKLGIYTGIGTLLILYGARLKFVTEKAALAERRLALVQEDTDVGVFEFDFEANEALISPSLSRMTGRPVVEGAVPLDKWLGELDPNHVKESREVIAQKLARNELRYDREQRIDLGNGNVRWLLSRIRLSPGSDGKIARAHGATVDITERKQADEALRQTQIELRQQLDDLRRLHQTSQELVTQGSSLHASLDALLELLAHFHRSKQGMAIACDIHGNESIVAHRGFSEQAVQQMSPMDPGGTTLLITGFQGKRIVIEDVRATDHAGWSPLSRQENFRAVHGMPLLNPAGELLGAIWVMLPDARLPDEREIRLGDICASTAAAVIELDRARAAAAANEHRFAVALDSSAVPFNILKPVRDDEARVIDFEWEYVNPAASSALGRSVEGLIGRRVGDLRPGTWDQADLLARFAGVADYGQSAEFELYSVATGTPHWLYVIASPLQSSIAVWFSDITARKTHEEELQHAGRRKDEFLATLAHELRNPLAPIRQALVIASSPASTPASKQRCHAIIERQVTHMALMLEDLLDVSRITRGSLNLRKSTVLLSGVVDSAVETASPTIEAKAHRLKKDLPAKDVLLFVDPLRIAQVLANLLTNAAKYTSPGGKIDLKIRTEDRNLIVSVIDNGIGLTADQMDKIFDMFSQCQSALAHSQGGLGIGLALSRQLVGLHGGTIEAGSAGSGCGSTFTIRIPEVCLTASPGELAKDGDPISLLGKHWASLRILIADDNVDSAESLAEILKMEGYRTEVAHDGQQALAAFGRLCPDVALLDLGMPGMSGFQVATAIRQSKTGAIPLLVAITGWGQDTDKRLATDAGFDFHLVKPVDVAGLLNLLAGWSCAEQKRDVLRETYRSFIPPAP
ncbi:hybrid sensor histidine kinase/response regulator [Paraburkholderia phytofirmans]|uniref:hybrid sensor histidine kinase/response regulator n=1 Tax=Paraburkholderia phytofirmans TaxID=261302 RepID=UPI0038BCF6F5